MQNFFKNLETRVLLTCHSKSKNLWSESENLRFQFANHASFGVYLNFPASYKNSLVFVAL